MTGLIEEVQSHEQKLQKLCEDFKATAAGILKLKKDAGSEKIPADALKDLLTKGSLSLIDIKECNRDIYLLADEHAKKALPSKVAVDEANLQLQNFIYEQQQYVSCIAACKKIVSRHKQIEMDGLEEYLKQHPEDRALVGKDEHQLMLQRLNAELAERKRAERTVQQLKDEKSAVKEGRKASEKFLEGLRDSLKGVKDSTRTMQEYLQVQIKERNKENKKASQLPSPLYILFQKWSAYATNFAADAVTVRINGSKRGVEQFADTLQKQLEADSEDKEPDAKKRKVSEDGGKAAAPLIGVNDAHPLCVEVAFDVREDDLEAAFTLKFHFIPLMNHLAVDLSVSKKASSQSAWLSDVTALRNLFPDDDGSLPPNPSSAFGSSELTPSLDPSKMPFKWVQWMGGYDFMFPLREAPASLADRCRPVGEIFNCRQRQGTAKIYKCIKDRLLARLCLCKQVEWLRKRQFGGVTLAQDPGKWQVLDPLKFSMFEEVAAAKDASPSQWPKTFKAVFHGDQHTFHAMISIPEDYPETQPLFMLSCPTQPSVSTKIPDKLAEKSDSKALDLLRQCVNEKPTNNALKNVEAEVNYNLQAHCAPTAGRDAYILMKQVLLLMRCLDIYLHVELGKTDRMCLRPSRGRDRALPFQWNATLNVFEH